MAKGKARRQRADEAIVPSRWPPPWSLAALALCLAGGAYLRLHDLGGPSLWTDELVSYWALSGAGPLDVIRRVSTCMATPPLSHLVQDLSVGLLGGNELALRLPSAIAGVLTIGVVFAAGFRMFGAAAGTVAAAFLTMHPFHLWWSTDGRPYSLAVLLAAGAVWAFSEAMRSGRPAALVGWAVCTAALVATQFIFLPLTAAQVLIWWIARRSGRAQALPPSRAGLAVGGAVLLASPIVPQMLAVSRRAGGLTWPAFIGNYPPGIYGLLQTTALVTAALLFVTYAASRRTAVDELRGTPVAEESTDVLAVFGSFLLPLLLLGGVALLAELPTLIKPRYGAVYVVPAALLAGWVTTRPAGIAGRAIFSGSFLLLVLATAVIPPLVRGESYNQNVNVEDWRSASELLASEWRDGDVLLLRSGLVETDLLYAGSFPAACESYVAAPVPGLYLPPGMHPHLLPSLFAEDPPPEYARRFGDLLAGQRRVWLLMAHPEDPGTYFQRAQAYVREASGLPLRLGRAGSFGSVTVALLAAPEGG